MECRWCWRVGARCWLPTPRSRKCRAPRPWPTSRSRRPALRAASATSRASRCWRSRPRPSAGRARGARARSGAHSRRTPGRFRIRRRHGADVALNMELREAYLFCRLSGPANVLIMPAFHSASISTKLLQERADRDRSDPGRARPPVQIVPLRPTTLSSSTWPRSRRSTWADGGANIE